MIARPVIPGYVYRVTCAGMDHVVFTNHAGNALQIMGDYLRSN